MHSSRLTGLSAGLLALALAASPAHAEDIKARYSVSLIGIPLGTAGLTARIGGGQYRIEANARLSGVASMVSNSRGAAVSTGGLSPNRPTPTTYATTSSSSTMTRTVRMALNAGTVRAVDISPPLQDHPARVPVTEGHKRSVIDPLSALVMPVPGKEPLIGPAACNRTIPIYDGYTRFDVALAYSATKEVATAGYNGPAVVCSARYVPVSGHRPDRKVTQFMADNRDMEVWLVPVQSTRVMLPYRISVATMIGQTVIEAQEFSLTPTRTRSAAR